VADMDRALDCTYSIPLSAVSNMDTHVKKLTMTPRQSGGFAAPEPFPVFRIEDDRLHVPRFYGMATFGPPERNGLTEGIALRDGVSFCGSMTPQQEEPLVCTLQKLRTTGGSLLVRKPGGGKTVLGIRIACELGRRTLVFCHTSSLLDQWEERIRKFAPDASIGRVQQRRTDVDCDFVLATYQSVSKRDYGDIFESFGLAIFDEAHHMGARQFFKVFGKLKCQYVLGLSATPVRRDGLTCLLHYGLGEVSHRDMGDDMECVDVTILRYTGGTQREVKVNNTPCVPLMINDLSKDLRRTQMIAKVVTNKYHEGRRIIVLSHVKNLLDELCVVCQTLGVPSDAMAVFTGDLNRKQREDAKLRRILLATYAIAKEGLDLEALDCEIMATPLGDVEQAVGRVQRPCKHKPTPQVVDVLDPFSVFVHTGRKRKRYYESKNFRVVEQVTDGR